MANAIRSENYGSIRLTTSIRINFPVSPTREYFGNSCRPRTPAQFPERNSWKILTTFGMTTCDVGAGRREFAMNYYSGFQQFGDS